MNSAENQPSITGNIFGMEDQEMKDLQPMSKKEFLNKLPNKIVSKGRVVDVRAEIEKKFDANEKLPHSFGKNCEYDENGNLVIESVVRRRLRNGELLESDEGVVKLKVRLERSGKNLILFVGKDDKISDVYNWVAPYKETSGEFQILNNWPRVPINSTDQKSLKELGLYPRACVLLNILS